MNLYIIKCYNKMLFIRIFRIFFVLIKFVVIERQYDEITESCEVSDLLVSKRKNIYSDTRMTYITKIQYLYMFYKILIIYYF